MIRIKYHPGTKQNIYSVLIISLVFMNFMVMYKHAQLQENASLPRSSLPIEDEDAPEQVSPHLPRHRIKRASPMAPNDSIVIGMATVTRKRSNYIKDTLESLFTHIRPSDKGVTVAVLLADENNMARMRLSRTLASKFIDQVKDGSLLLLQPTEDNYPALDNITQTYGDSPDRLLWRAKQALDFAFLWSEVRRLGTYFLHLEDDVLSSPGFITDIRKTITGAKGFNGKWTCLEFSRLGFIGKLYRSRDLERLASFARIFHDRHPVDFLMRYFNDLMGQPKAIVHEPSLFQHVGFNSSLESKVQPLVDPNYRFKPKFSQIENPPATLVSTIKEIKPYSLDLAYSRSPGYFWGMPPKIGDVIWILLKEPAQIKMINVTTGSDKYKNDFLKGGLLEGGSTVAQVSTNLSEIKCSNMVYLGAFEDGQLLIRDIDKQFASFLQCLRISVILNQNNWILIDSISIHV